MVGGTVVEAIPCEVDGQSRVWINVRDPREHECAIYVKGTPQARSVSPGDLIWWQGPWAMWTPRTSSGTSPFSDHRLSRIGCSGVGRPERRAAPAGEQDP